MANHLIDALFGQAMTHPGRLFAQTPKGRQMSRGDLALGSARIAGALRGLGLAPGDRVAAQTEKSLEALQLYLGTVMAGGVFLPLNTAYTPAELRYFLSDATPRIFVCDPDRAEALAPLARASGAAHCLTLDGAGRGSLIDRALDASALDVTRPRGPEDLAAILYTSGTTGRSKGAMLSHRALLANSQTLVEAWHFTQDDVLIHALPIYHTHGLFVASNVALLSGASCLFMRSFDADLILKALPQATTMMGVPTHYTRLLAETRLTRELTENMRLFISGSAPLLAETHRQWTARTGHAILERYGMTETNMNTSNPYDAERRPGTVGLPLPGVECRIMEGDSTAAPGAVGEIEVRGENLFSGYWQMPDKTAEDMRPDGWFRTGDLGRFDDDGYLVLVGRSKDLIISGGLNVYPKEVESVLDALPGVLESAVIGVPHSDFGEAVAAVVVPDGTAPIEEAGLLAAAAPALAGFKRPKRVLFAEALPRNAMGKVQKARLREAHADLFADA